MKLYKTIKGHVMQDGNDHYLLQTDWNELINRNNLFDYLQQQTATAAKLSSAQVEQLIREGLESPAGTQEIWAAGVTYLRSRDARMEEAKESGGATFYDKVYVAERPELFFKALPHRVAANGEEVYIRKDSSWNVPEPELALFINSEGSIQGYTIGNDMSSRSIEGENPLYLPQAKVYQRSAALGPCLLVTKDPIDPSSEITMKIERDHK